jgi:hypothetical protein
MLPAISALDCLVADLGLDPGAVGCTSYESTGFVLAERVPDTAALLVLWQPAAVGQRFGGPDAHGSRLGVLVEHLCRFYPADHEVIVYESSAYVVANPIIRRVPLGELGEESVTSVGTLVVPPSTRPVGNRAVAEQLRWSLSGQ